MTYTAIHDADSDRVHFQATSAVTGTTHDFQRLSDVVMNVNARIYGGMHCALLDKTEQRRIHTNPALTFSLNLGR
jgi:hypothetical protein